MATLSLEETAKPAWTALHAIEDLVDRMEQVTEPKDYRDVVEELEILVDRYSYERLAFYAGIILHPAVGGDDKAHIWPRFQHELTLGPRLTVNNDVLDAALTVFSNPRWRDASRPCADIRRAVLERGRTERRAGWRYLNTHIPFDRIDELKIPPSFAEKVQLEHDMQVLFRAVPFPVIRRLIVARLKGKVDPAEHGWSAQEYYALNRALAADRQLGQRLRQWVRMYLGPKFVPKK